jgi:hypothetical protein
MEKHIYVSNYSTNGIDLGEIKKYEIFKGTWFEQLEPYGDNNIIHKAIILSIHYEPDSTYSHTDGYDGTCWSARITDSGENEYILCYHFSNFSNLVKFYEEKGYKFVEK